MLEYAIDGHDGSAKTPILDGVRAALQAHGLKVHTVAIFHVVNARVSGGEVYPMWEQDESASEAVRMLKIAVEEARQEARNAGADVLLFDRHWMTVMVETMFRPTQGLWDDFLPTFFIEAPPSKTMACDRFSHDIPWTTSDRQVFVYYALCLAIAKMYAEHIVQTHLVEHKQTPIEPMISDITAHILDDVEQTKNPSV